MFVLGFTFSADGFQASINVPNGTGAQVRANTNNALQAITTFQSGSSAPTVTYPYMYWVDTSASPAILKQRNSANNAWISVMRVGVSGNYAYMINADYATLANSANSASTLSGLFVHTGSRNNEANKVVRTDSNGYLPVGFINMVANITTTSPSHYAIQTDSDSYIRWMTKADVRTDLVTKTHIDSLGINAGTLGGYSSTSFPYTQSESGLRIIRGNINADGTTSAGSGFSSSKLGTGSYRIIFTNAFSSPPTCFVYGQRLSYYNQFPTTGQFGYYLMAVTTGSLMDDLAGFMCIGPN